MFSFRTTPLEDQLDKALLYGKVGCFCTQNCWDTAKGRWMWDIFRERGNLAMVFLSVLSKDDEQCRAALAQLPKLRGCQVHSTVMLSEVDRKIFKKLGCGLTCDPVRKK